MKNWSAFWQKKYREQELTEPQDICLLAEQLNLPHNLVYDNTDVLTLDGAHHQFNSPDPDKVPTHPGRLLSLAVEQTNISQADFARILGVSKTLLNLILHEQRSVTLEMALAFEQLTSVPAHVLMRMQADYSLYEARMAILKAQKERIEIDHTIRMNAIAERYVELMSMSQFLPSRAAQNWEMKVWFYGDVVAGSVRRLVEKLRHEAEKNSFESK